MLAKLATLDLLKINVFWIKDYDIIISVHGVVNKILSLESNHIVGMVMWPKFGSSSISMTEVIINSILLGFYKKKQFFEGYSGLKFNSLRLVLGMTSIFYTIVAKD